MFIILFKFAILQFSHSCKFIDVILTCSDLSGTKRELIQDVSLFYFQCCSLEYHIQMEYLKLTFGPATCSAFSLVLRRLPFSPRQRHCEPCDYGRIRSSMHGSGRTIVPLVILATKMVVWSFSEKVKQIAN